MLPLQPARVADQGSIGSDDPVAGQHDRDGVAVHDRPHRPRGPRLAGAGGELAVGCHLAERDATQLLEHRAAEVAGEAEVDVRFLSDYNRVVLDELARVEYGTTTTYGTLAARTGNPRAARAVGTIMNRNPIPIVLPCHRVVGSTGKLVGYGGGLDRKERLLRLEGALL